MLARELKSKIKKEGKIAYFIVAQTFKGNSYTCQLSKEEDIDRLHFFQKELLPNLLADNLFPEFHFLDNTALVSIKFNEIVNKDAELVKFVEPVLSFHVDDKIVNEKTVQNRIAIKCIKRDVEDYPDKVKRTLEHFQGFLGQIAESAILSEYRQGSLFETNDYKVEIKTYPPSPFDEVEKATQEITGSAAPQEQIEGMKAAANERVKERQAEAEKLGVPVEIREEEL